MECPSCHREAIQASEALTAGDEGAWWLCPDQACLQPPWLDTGRRGRPGENAPLVQRLVGLEAEQLERAADYQRPIRVGSSLWRAQPSKPSEAKCRTYTA